MNVLAAATVDMPDSASIGIFVAATIAIGVAVVAFLPRPLRSLRLATAVMVLALVGPAIALVSVLTGVGLMAVTGHAVEQLLVIAAVSASAAVVVAHRLTRPLAGDLEAVSSAIRDIANGDRSIVLDIDRSDQIGSLARSVNELNRSLCHAEAERDASDEERQAVICSLSHDLRTPLTSLLASIDALDDQIGDPGRQRAIARRNVMTMKQLVDDLFLLARADSGYFLMHPEVYDIAELVDEAAEALEGAARLRGVVIERRALSAYRVSCDAEATGRMLRNIVDNAVRYTPEGGVVSLSVQHHGSSVDVVVDDQGPGFPDGFVALAFERFSQADPARSQHGGAGLGLAITRTLAEAQGGSVSIQEAIHGRVRISLPVAMIREAVVGARTGHSVR